MKVTGRAKGGQIISKKKLWGLTMMVGTCRIPKSHCRMFEGGPRCDMSHRNGIQGFDKALLLRLSLGEGPSQLEENPSSVVADRSCQKCRDTPGEYGGGHRWVYSCSHGKCMQLIIIIIALLPLSHVLTTLNPLLSTPVLCMATF